MQLPRRPGDLIEMDADECLRRFADEPVSRLAFTTPDGPDILPVNHVVVDGTVYFRTNSGTKLGEAAAGAAVAIEADHYEAESREAWSVVIKGRARIETDAAAIERLHRLPFDPWAAPDLRTFWIAIDPGSVTGRMLRNEG